MKYIILLTLLVLSSCTPVGTDKCGNDSPSLALARSFTAPQLSQLYSGHLVFIAEREPGDHWWQWDNEPLPKEMDFLPIKTVRYYRSGIASYRLEGCIDHHLDIVVIEASEEQSARIEVHWGEAPFRSEILWQQ